MAKVQKIHSYLKEAESLAEQCANKEKIFDEDDSPKDKQADKDDASELVRHLAKSESLDSKTELQIDSRLEELADASFNVIYDISLK